MSSFTVTGDIDETALRTALAEAFPGTEVIVEPTSLINGDTPIIEELDAKDNELLETQRSHIHALQSIKQLTAQQEKLFNEFAVLRGKYDALKDSQTTLLWEHTAEHHPLLKDIPSCNLQMIESDERVGNYTVGEMLGEGQFATVKACKKDGEDKELALKIIKKNRIQSFNGMRRVSNEIGTLKELRNNKHVVHITSAMQGANDLYIVTEVGGPDLFDFFDEHPDGVQENWARDIAFRVLKAVRSCHDMNICHLDLKPENILLEFDYDSNTCTEVKLCDFGLCNKIGPERLTNFCGSPGFFAPEMITVGSYDGHHADIWSLGCIILEMVLGHERFCDAWMAAYDYETLQDAPTFSALVDTSVNGLPGVLDFSPPLNDFIVKMLKKNPAQRMTAGQAMAHPWLEELNNKPCTPPSCDASAVDTIDEGESKGLLARPGSAEDSFPVAEMKMSKSDGKLLIASLSGQVSNRERKMITDYNQQHTDIHLPPIEPQTPSIGRARKILKQGQSLATKAELGFPNGLDSPKTSRAVSIDETVHEEM